MILITGASGFIGSFLCAKIPNKRVVLRRKNSPNLDSAYYVDAINERTDWSGAFESIDCIVHLASIAHSNDASTERLHSVNVMGTKNLAQQAIAAGVKKFIFVSSIGVNGFSTSEGQKFLASSIPSPHNPYAQSKYDAELELQKLFNDDTKGILHIVRPPLVYGEGAPGNFKLLTKLVSSTPILPFGLANNHRSFISVHNLVDLLAYLTKLDTQCNQILLAAEEAPVSTKVLTNRLAKALGKKLWQIPIPKQLFLWLLSLVGKKTIYTQLFDDLIIDYLEIQRLTGWIPPFTMEQALQIKSEKNAK